MRRARYLRSFLPNRLPCFVEKKSKKTVPIALVRSYGSNRFTYFQDESSHGRSFEIGREAVALLQKSNFSLI